ncbi:competence protein ComEA [Arthrobacter glacialis]|uniref:Competence protein ComEA n=2 Tax=Arthrobacter glacialis TaxID=1664 RepID=A0A2S3ZW36_ARTGL|nr:competence protein ComEA [Arthrobacter glacialis]
MRAYRSFMSGIDGNSTWTPQESGNAAVRGQEPVARGPRWIISLRALVVVLAMMGAALGVLWIESASVQSASAELSAQDVGKVTVPPVAGTAGPSPSSVPSLVPSSAQSGAGAAAGAAKPSDGAAGAPSGGLLVHVAGAVKNPGVYTLPTGSRAFQAVEAAGGALPTAELSALNLAAPIIDGLQILVPAQGQAAGTAAPASGAEAPGQKPGMGALINLNTASAADFDALPGVGPVLAQRIVAWRSDHGPFSSVDALDGVSGIGAKLLAGIRDLVTV